MAGLGFVLGTRRSSFFAPGGLRTRLNTILVIGAIVMAPIFFLAGIGSFDYWFHYISGRPTQPETIGSRRVLVEGLLRVNTDHKVIGIQYLVTTFVFFTIGGPWPCSSGPSSHSRGSVRRLADVQRPCVRARDADDLPVHHPGVRWPCELRVTMLDAPAHWTPMLKKV